MDSAKAPIPPHHHPTDPNKISLLKLAPEMPSPEDWDSVSSTPHEFSYVSAITILSEDEEHIKTWAGLREERKRRTRERKAALINYGKFDPYRADDAVVQIPVGVDVNVDIHEDDGHRNSGGCWALCQALGSLVLCCGLSYALALGVS